MRDAEWLRHAIAGRGSLVPGQVAAFGLNEVDRARAWVTSMAPTADRFY